MIPPLFPRDLQLDPVRTGVVGLGYWGPNLIRNLQELETSEVSWICDLDRARLQSIGKRYPAARSTTSFDDLLDDPSSRLSRSPPPSRRITHSRWLRSRPGSTCSSRSRWRHRATEAKELMTVAEERGLTLMPGHTFLYSPPVNMIRDLIRSGELGEIYFISMSRVNLGLHQSDVSVAWDLGPHDFSILRYWLDATPSHVSAMSRSCVFPGIPDVAFINLEYLGGAIAHVELSWLAPSKLRRTTVVGSNKMVVYDDVSPEPVRVFDSGVMLRDPQSFGEFQLSYRTGEIVSPAVQPAEPLQVEMADFCQAIRSGKAPRSSAELGVAVVRMIEAVDVSLASSGNRVPLGGEASIAA